MLCSVQQWLNSRQITARSRATSAERCLVCARDVLLIDEMSLITPNMLADIDRALKKATRCEHDFGNWLAILSGDFFQINDDVQYHNHTANDARCP